MRLLAGTLILILTLLMPLQAFAGSGLCLTLNTDSVTHSMDQDMDHSCCESPAGDNQCHCDQISAPSLIGAVEVTGLAIHSLRPLHHLTYYHPSLNYQPEKPPQIS